MRPTILALLLTLAVPVGAAAQVSNLHSGAITAPVQKGVDDAARQADKHDDARRKVALVMTFAEVKPGQKVLELVPGSGYWTRVFSAIVGPTGHVYTVWPDEMMQHLTKAYSSWQKLVATPHYENVTLLKEPAEAVRVPQNVDLVFTSQNYHDYHDFAVNMAAFNKHVFAALKPGGLFVIIDHVAPAGSGFTDTNTLHRIDPAAVKREVEAAGFVLDGESNALRNPADPHTATVFDKSIRGHTDQFIYRFRKPAK